MHLNLHTEMPRQLLIRACNCNVCTLHRQHESNFRLIKIMSKRKVREILSQARDRNWISEKEFAFLMNEINEILKFHISTCYPRFIQKANSFTEIRFLSEPSSCL